MSRDQVRGCQYGSPEFGLLRHVVHRGTLWPLPVGGYSGSDGRPVHGVLPELVKTLLSDRLIDVDRINGSLAATKYGRSLLSSVTHEHIEVSGRYPFLGALGSPNSESACNDLIQEHLPGRLLSTPTASARRRIECVGWDSGDIYGLRSSAGAPGSNARVAGRFALAAAVALVIEEFLRFDREPPTELLACAALCWAEDLLRQVPGYPLRSTGDRP